MYAYNIANRVLARVELKYMYTKVSSALKLHFSDKSRHKHTLCVLVLRYYICVCNSTPMCFLKKSRKAVRTFEKEFNFMKI